MDNSDIIEEENLLAGDGRASKKITKSRVVQDTAPVEEVNPLEELRDEAYAAEGYQWGGKVLEAFGSGRVGLFHRLRRRLDAPSVMECYENTELFYSDAEVILYLCSHSHKELAGHLVYGKDILPELLEWSDANIPRASLVDASLIAMKILTDSQINRAENVPEDSSGGSELGN